jgi:hypothetical protein
LKDLAELKEGQRQLKEGLQKDINQALLEFRKSNELLRQELSEKLNTEVGKVTIEVNQVKGEVRKCENKLEREMIGVKQQFERERGEQDLKIEQLANYQEAEIANVKQQVREVRVKVDVSNAEITNSVKENVNAIQERLGKVEGISHELLHLNSSVEQIQQKLEDNASEASRQLREQGRQKEQNNNQSNVQENSQVFEIQESEKNVEVQFGEVETVSGHCIKENQESSLGLAKDVTRGVVKFLRPRADKKLDAELAKKANVTCCSIDNCEVQVPKKRSRLNPKNIQDKDLRTIVEQSNPKNLIVYARVKEIARTRKSKKRKVKFKWQPQVGEQVLAKEQPVSNAVKRLYEGPFVIKEVVNVYLYKLQSKSGNIKGLFHISHLKPYVTPDENV